jgi:hypothetical protein
MVRFAGDAELSSPGTTGASAAILPSRTEFGSIRAAQFNIPVARQRQRETSGNIAA